MKTHTRISYFGAALLDATKSNSVQLEAKLCFCYEAFLDARWYKPYPEVRVRFSGAGAGEGGVVRCGCRVREPF